MSLNINNYLSIAEYLKDYESISAIKNINEVQGKSKYILSFMGQFSAGKSKLINNILDRDILPVHITETTPIITFIMYSQEEQAILTYNDGHTEVIDLNDVKKIWQNSTEFKCLETLKTIEILLNCDILKNGLVIADTPGINTIISKHKDLTISLIENTQEFIYVMAKPLTDTDKLFLQKISNIGSKVSFVRTHIDEMLEEEENIDLAIQKEHENINNIIGIPCDVYFVSNEINNKWFSKIDNIKEYLNNEFTTTMQQKFNEYYQTKTEYIKQRLYQQLKDRIEKLHEVDSKSKEELQEKKLNLEKEISNIKQLLARKEGYISNNISNIKLDAKEDLNLVKNQIKKQGELDIQSYEYSVDYEQVFLRNVQNLIEEAYSKLQDAYYSTFNDFISCTNIELINEIKNTESLTLNIPLPENVNELINNKIQEDYMLQSLKKQVSELETTLKEREEYIKNSDDISKEFEQKQNELRVDIIEIENEIALLGDYTPKYIEKEQNGATPSSVMGNIGKILDNAMLLIPSTAYSKLSGKLAKVITNTSKAKKVADTGKIIGRLDPVKDTLYLLDKYNEYKETKNVQNQIETFGKATKSKLDILDMATCEYWFKVVGKNFDPPKRMTIDKEYEMAYKNTYQELKAKSDMAKKKEIELKEKAGLFNDNIKRQQEIQKIETKKTLELQNEIKKQENSIREKAKKNAFENYKRQYINWYNDKIDMICNQIIEASNDYINQAMEDYKKYCTYAITSELNNYIENYNTLINGKDNVALEIQQCNTYFTMLEA